MGLDDFKRQNKKFSPKESLEKISRYCAYQERSHQETRNKLFSYGLTSDDVEDILSQLITSGFLNEERFAKGFAGGKFRTKRWGKNKIINQLEGKGVTGNCIASGLKEIDDVEYRKTLDDLITKKEVLSLESNLFIKRDKLARYVISKGYEPELVWERIKLLIKD